MTYQNVVDVLTPVPVHLFRRYSVRSPPEIAISMPEVSPASTHGGRGLVVLELVKVEVLNDVALALGRNRELAGKGRGPLSLCSVSDVSVAFKIQARAGGRETSSWSTSRTVRRRSERMVSEDSWNSAGLQLDSAIASCNTISSKFARIGSIAADSGRMVTTVPVGTSALAVSRSSRPEFGDLAIFVPRCRKAPWADLGFGALVVRRMSGLCRCCFRRAARKGIPTVRRKSILGRFVKEKVRGERGELRLSSECWTELVGWRKDGCPADVARF